MKIRIKFGSRRLPVDVTAGSNDRVTVGDVIRCASQAFGLQNDSVGVSLNGEDFLGPADGTLDASAWGLVAGDLLHLRSDPPAPMHLEEEEASCAVEEEPSQPASSSSEYYSPSASCQSQPSVAVEFLPRTLSDMLQTFEPQSPCQYMALVIHSLFMDAGFLPPPNQLFEPRWSSDTAVIRLSYLYKGPQLPSTDKAPVTVTLMDCGHFVSVSAQVTIPTGSASFFSASFKVSNFFESHPRYDRLRLINQADLGNTIRDELLEKMRQELHSYFGLLPVGLLRLPNELQFRILRELDCKALCRMEATCSLYRHLARPIWRHLLQRDFSEDYDRAKAAGVRDWKMSYQECFERAKARTEARRRALERTEAFSFHAPDEDWRGLMPLPPPPALLGPPLRPPGPGMLGGPHDLWPAPLAPRGPFRPWFRHQRP